MKKSFVYLIMIIVFTTALTPQNSQATMIMMFEPANMLTKMRGHYGLKLLLIGTCLLLWPACIVEGEGNIDPLTVGQLMENGYSAEEAKSILSSNDWVKDQIKKEEQSGKIDNDRIIDLVTEAAKRNPLYGQFVEDNMMDVQGQSSEVLP